MLTKLRIDMYISQFFPLFCTHPVDNTPKNLFFNSYNLRNYWRSKHSAEFEDVERLFILNFKTIRHNLSSFHISPKMPNSAAPPNTRQLMAISFLRCFRLTGTQKNKCYVNKTQNVHVNVS
jgi:hypothetical protein